MSLNECECEESLNDPCDVLSFVTLAALVQWPALFLLEYKARLALVMRYAGVVV